MQVSANCPEDYANNRAAAAAQTLICFKQGIKKRGRVSIFFL